MTREYSCEEEAQYYADIAKGEEEAMIASQAAAAEAEILAQEAAEHDIAMSKVQTCPLCGNPDSGVPVHDVCAERENRRG